MYTFRSLGILFSFPSLTYALRQKGSIVETRFIAAPNDSTKTFSLDPISRISRCFLIARASFWVGATIHKVALSPSALSSFDLGVERFEFLSGVFNFELPIDAALFLVGTVGPVFHFRLQFSDRFEAAA